MRGRTRSGGGRGAGAARSALDSLTGLSLTGLSDDDVTGLLDAGTAASARTTAVLGRVAAEADRRRLGDATGARNTIAWWARRSRLTRGEAGRLLHLGRALDRDHHAPVSAALAAGGVLADQAGVIVEAVDALPTDLPDPALRAAPRRCCWPRPAGMTRRRCGSWAAGSSKPSPPRSAKPTNNDSSTPRNTPPPAAARLTLADDGHGKIHGRFILPTLHGELLRTHLMALANPRRHPHPDEPEANQAAREITPQRLGEALMEYVERYPATALPWHGGSNASLAVTITLDSLLTGLGAATLTTGHRISAGEARRLACRAGLLPAVLGTDCEVLGLGHTSRFFKGPSKGADSDPLADFHGLLDVDPPIGPRAIVSAVELAQFVDVRRPSMASTKHHRRHHLVDGAHVVLVHDALEVRPVEVTELAAGHGTNAGTAHTFGRAM